MTDLEKLTAQLEALNKNLADLIARMPPHYVPPMYYPPQPSPTAPVNPYFPQGPWVTVSNTLDEGTRAGKHPGQQPLFFGITS